MMGLWKGLSPVNTFFRDRYFPTEPGDIYAADKVLCEYQDGDHGMAPFMVDRADPIPVARQGYEIHDYAPTKLSQSRMLTIDDASPFRWLHKCKSCAVAPLSAAYFCYKR